MKRQKTLTPSHEEGPEYWAIRLDSGDLSTEDQDRLDQWLAHDERREGALLRAQAALAYLDRGRALPTPATQTRIMSRRNLFMMGGAAAAASVAGLSLWLSRPQMITTQVGEVREVALNDGSVAKVNTDTVLKVQFGSKQRLIDLASGEAWFKVAHNTERPFIIEAGGLMVRAVGTAFSVRRTGSGAEVLVTEGIVETWQVGNEAQKSRINAGMKATLANQSLTTKTDGPEIERMLAWRQGELALDGQSVEYAVAEINRYNLRKIVVDSPRLRNEPLVGYFRIDEPEKFSRAVASLIDAQVDTSGDNIRIVEKAS